MLTARAAAAQVWRASAQLGRVTSASAPASAGTGASAVLGISRTATHGLLGISVALPVNGEPFWATLGAWRRIATRGGVGAFADLSAHGFVQRFEGTAPASPLPTAPSGPTIRDYAVSGAGLGAEGLAGLHAAAGRVRIEVRGGAAGRRSELNGIVTERILPTADARVIVARLPIVLQGESRGWWRRGERHTYAGGSARLAHGPVQLWGATGAWLSGGESGLVWSAGGSTDLGPRLALQVSVRANAFDPLYLTTTGTALAAGMTLRIGGAPGVRAPIPASYRNGRAEVRLDAREVRGRPSVAGDFTGWRPVPMQREGNRWVWRGDLAPGTYGYAFVAADGSWFVPASVAGRRDDGMGGQQAVLVVAP